MAKKSSNQLAQRRARKRKKPFFLRQDGHKLTKLAKNWRRPRGLHNKVRLKKRGYRRNVTVGWKSPVSVRGLSRTGLAMVMVHGVDALSALNPTTQAIIIGKTVGTKKRIAIVKAALERKLTILNIKEPAKFLTMVEEQRKKLKDEKEKTAKEKEKKEEEKKKTVKKEAPEEKKEEKSIETIAEEETKKEQEKKEMDKVLTQKV